MKVDYSTILLAVKVSQGQQTYIIVRNFEKYFFKSDKEERKIKISNKFEEDGFYFDVENEILSLSSHLYNKIFTSNKIQHFNNNFINAIYNRCINEGLFNEGYFRNKNFASIEKQNDIHEIISGSGCKCSYIYFKYFYESKIFPNITQIQKLRFVDELKNSIFFLEGEEYKVFTEKRKLICRKYISTTQLKIGNCEISELFKSIKIKGVCTIYPAKVFTTHSINHMFNIVNSSLITSIESGETFLWKEKQSQTLSKLFSFFNTNKLEYFLDTIDQIGLIDSQTIKQEIPIRKIRKVTHSIGKELIKNFETTSIHQKITLDLKKRSKNNPENQVLKFLCLQLYNILNMCSLKRDGRIMGKLKYLIQQRLLEVEDIHIISQVPIVFLEKPGYRHIWNIYNNYILLLKQSTYLPQSLSTKNPIKSIDEIYEMYTFIEIKNILENVYFKRFSPISDSIILNKRSYKYQDLHSLTEDRPPFNHKLTGYIEMIIDHGTTLRLIYGDYIAPLSKIHKKLVLYGKNIDASDSTIKSQDIINLTNQYELKIIKILGGSFGKKSEQLTPDISLEVREKGELKRKIIFDTKFSAFREYIDETDNFLDVPNSVYYEDEVKKYFKIGYKKDNKFQSWSQNIFILYPGEINEGNLEAFEELNYFIQKEHNVILLPIYPHNCELVRHYIENLLKTEIQNPPLLP